MCILDTLVVRGEGQVRGGAGLKGLNYPPEFFLAFKFVGLFRVTLAHVRTSYASHAACPAIVCSGLLSRHGPGNTGRSAVCSKEEV
jgi:hypothetical protein